MIRLIVQDFFSRLEPDEMPDVLAIHIYTTTFDSFRASVEEYYSMFRLPIMITEFAVQVSQLDAHYYTEADPFRAFLGMYQVHRVSSRCTTLWVRYEILDWCGSADLDRPDDKVA